MFVNTTQIIESLDDYHETMNDFKYRIQNYIKIKENPTAQKASDTSSEEENFRAWDFPRIIGLRKDADYREIC